MDEPHVLSMGAKDCVSGQQIGTVNALFHQLERYVTAIQSTDETFFFLLRFSLFNK